MTNPDLINPRVFLEIGAGGTNSGFPMFFQGYIVLYLLNIFTNAAPKWDQKYQKWYFGFSNCKLPELAGCFTLFKVYTRYRKWNDLKLTLLQNSGAGKISRIKKNFSFQYFAEFRLLERICLMFRLMLYLHLKALI